MINQICPHCQELIPPGWVQNGGLHMTCFETEIDVWFVSLPHNPESGYCEADLNNITEMLKYAEEPYLITKKTMTAGEYHNLPEFEGF